MNISLTQYIGPEGAAFERVGLAFQAYNFLPPKADVPDQGPPYGAYVANIVEQYRADLRQVDVLAIIEFGLTNTRENLKWILQDPKNHLLQTNITYLGDIYQDYHSEVR